MYLSRFHAVSTKWNRIAIIVSNWSRKRGFMRVFATFFHSPARAIADFDVIEGSRQNTVLNPKDRRHSYDILCPFKLRLRYTFCIGEWVIRTPYYCTEELLWLSPELLAVVKIVPNNEGFAKFVNWYSETYFKAKERGGKNLTKLNAAKKLPSAFISIVYRAIVQQRLALLTVSGIRVLETCPPTFRSDVALFPKTVFPRWFSLPKSNLFGALVWLQNAGWCTTARFYSFSSARMLFSPNERVLLELVVVLFFRELEKSLSNKTIYFDTLML